MKLNFVDNQTFRELIPKELNSGINSNFSELGPELNLFKKSGIGIILFPQKWL